MEESGVLLQVEMAQGTVNVFIDVDLPCNAINII